MADETTQRRKGRQLPPLAQRSDENETADPTPRKHKKKRVPKTDEEVDLETAVHKRSKHKSGDGVRSENEVDSARPSTTKRKKKKPVGSSREALMSEGEALSDRTDASASKKKKKKKAPRSAHGAGDGTDNLGLAAELADLEEDVIGQDDESIDAKWTVAPMMKSEPLNKVFIEKESGFKSKDKIKLERKRAVQEELRKEIPQEKPSRDTMYFALGTHKVFRTVCVFLQGLLAGIALWHIVSSWVLSNYGSEEFLEYYHKLALPVSCMYYFLFAVSTVAVLDRYDLARPTRRLFTRCCTFQSGAIAIVIYFIGIIFTTATTHLDDKIGLYKSDDELWDDTDERRQDIATWRILNLMRGLMAIIGWIIISLRPQTDQLTKNLKALDDNIFGDEFVTHLDDVATE